MDSMPMLVILLFQAHYHSSLCQFYVDDGNVGIEPSDVHGSMLDLHVLQLDRFQNVVACSLKLSLLINTKNISS